MAALSLVAGTLVFPLSAWSAVPAVAAIAAGVACLLLARRARGRSAKLSLRMTAVALMLGGTAWAGVALLIRGPEPTYVFVSPATANPFDAYIKPLGSSSEATAPPARLLAITDPLRPRLAAWIDKRWPLRLRRIETARYDGRYYVVAPLETSFLHIAPTAHPSVRRVSQLLNFLYRGPKLDLVATGPASFGFNPGARFNVGHSVSYTYFADQGMPLWQAVDCGETIEPEEIEYAALLDLALTEASLGRLDRALDGLSRAARIAPSRIEIVRSSSLLAHWSLYVFGGTLGGLQAVSYYRYAASRLAEVGNEQSSSRHTALLMEWAAQKLTARMTMDEELFAESLRELKLQVAARARVQRRGPIDIGFLFTGLEKGGVYQQFMKRTSALPFDRWLAEAGDPAIEPAVARLFIETSFNRLLAVWQRPPAERAAFLHAVKHCAARTGPEWQAAYAPLLSWQEVMLSDEDDHDTDTEALEVATLLEMGQMPKSAKQMRQLIESPGSIPDAPPRMPIADWWTSDFIDWFMAVQLMSSAVKDPPPGWRPRSRVNVLHLTRDRGGAGVAFVPGIAVAWQVARKVGNDALAWQLGEEFRRLVGVSIEDYISLAAQSRLTSI